MEETLEELREINRSLGEEIMRLKAHIEEIQPESEEFHLLKSAIVDGVVFGAWPVKFKVYTVFRAAQDAAKGAA